MLKDRFDLKTVKIVSGQTGWQLFGKVLSSLSTLFLLSVISRFYGEFGTGVYTLAITYLAFFNLIADLGMNAYGIRFLERSDDVFNKLLSFRFVLSIFLTIFSLVGAFLFFSDRNVFLAISFGSLSIISSAIYVSANMVFQSKLRYDLSIIGSTLSSFVSALFIIVIIYFIAPVSYLTIGHSIGWILCALVAIFLVRRFLTLHFIIDRSFIKNMFFENWPVSLTMVLNIVYFRIDTFILSSYRGLTDVGVYNFSYQFFSNALVVPTFMMNALYPLFLKAFKESRSSFFRLLLKASLIMGSVGLFGSILTYFVAPHLLPLIAGEGRFVDSVYVLQILAFSFPAFFLSAVFMWAMVTVSLYKKMFVIYLIGLIVNFILNINIIPTYSYLGAAWVTVICEYLILLSQAIILLWYFKKQ